MEEEILSFVITRRTANYWTYTVNEEPFTRDANAYTGTREGNWLVFKTMTGAPQVKNVYFGVVEYYDNLDSDNNLLNPSTPEELQGHLLAQGFYLGSGGGTGGVTTFKQLLDTNVISFLGRALQVLRINADETLIESVPSEIASLRLRDLVDYLNGLDYFPPNEYVLTSSATDEDGNALGFVTAPIQAIVNRPPRFTETSVVKKGFKIVDGDFYENEEDYASEVGDIMELIVYDEDLEAYFHYPEAQWLGGDQATITNFDWSYRIKLSNITT